MINKENLVVLDDTAQKKGDLGFHWAADAELAGHIRTDLAICGMRMTEAVGSMHEMSCEDFREEIRSIKSTLAMICEHSLERYARKERIGEALLQNYEHEDSAATLERMVGLVGTQVAKTKEGVKTLIDEPQLDDLMMLAKNAQELTDVASCVQMNSLYILHNEDGLECLK